MRKINKPEITQEDIFNNFETLEYRNILEEKSKNYENYFKDLTSLYLFEKNMIAKDDEYLKYMKKMYSERFSNNSYKKLYKQYLTIRTSVKICPFCNFPARRAKQLDHYFPKAVFPSLALTPVNLVPICRECNTDKDDYFSLDQNKMLIHPYFDEFVNDSFQFIKCRIIEEQEIGFDFYIDKKCLDAITFERINLHFDQLNLNDLYSMDFDSDFSVIVEELIEIYTDNDETIAKLEVETFIKKKIKAYRKNGTKPWYFAGYTAILENAWFFESYLSGFSHKK